MINLQYFHYMNCQTQKALNNTFFFGNILVLLAGDFNQHAPPSGVALYKDCAKFKQHEFHEVHAGSNDWRQIDNAFLFNTIHRFTSDNSGRQLHKMSQVFIEKQKQTPEDIEKPTPRHSLRSPHYSWRRNGSWPRCPRHCSSQCTKASFNSSHFSSSLCLSSNANVYLALVWYNFISFISSTHEWALNHHPDINNNIPAINLFFEGIQYLINDSETPGLGRVHNNTATGVKLSLHPDEIVSDENKEDAVIFLMPSFSHFR